MISIVPRPMAFPAPECALSRCFNIAPFRMLQGMNVLGGLAFRRTIATAEHSAPKRRKARLDGGLGLLTTLAFAGNL
ncbi:MULTISPECIES: hypothetical protein [unclassified Mesorhizobium]|uniref:hypothetical protein n=1 Tax=unclassified Mesorhizobium TaxID=325217 RepID=UPI0015E2CE87|nr:MULTISPECIES: hypothetical protein [unclassified Mesorhizobium]